ncbi:hypothetical protein [Streptomyces sp. G1]|uniref:hypothetical protein n=1 Tax=Streptomyces sp. G1 TaxID=361572 RepID=UPI0020302424|nr:hypothetical protein [Streptomyces sp. G1]MCM1972302.1 hypothetical protein [Streptomyces sp. G1]
MGFLDRILGDDQQRAARFEGRESASETAARKRREGHRRSIAKTAAKGQAWEERDRKRERRGGIRRTDWT